VNFLDIKARSKDEAKFRTVKDMLGKGLISKVLDEYDLKGEVQNNRKLFDRVVIDITNGLYCFSLAMNGQIKRARVLDLGCGSNGENAEAELYPGEYYPWFARALHALDIKVVGIDVGSLQGERFEHYEKDLLTPGSLDFLGTGYFDVVYSSRLFSSPELEKRCSGIVRPGDADKNARERLRFVLLPQIERVLKKRGYFITSNPEWTLDFEVSDLID